jgi:single-stranded-DNA-specific exonuclease
MSPTWHLSTDQPPTAFTQAVQAIAGTRTHLAPLLWRRGHRDIADLPGFLDASQYRPTAATAFGPELTLALDRLTNAHQQRQKVAIWGDFDADGVTATAVLWDGLGQFFTQPDQLTYYIPNRLTESHGLSRLGLDQLQAQGCRLIVTCDTGSTSLDELAYAQTLGIDVIITDHHSLPAQRPPCCAILNPRSLPPDHPLSALSGVAVAYKLVEALYERLPAPPQPLERLLDLVAIGLIADLVALQGDCRYLAQIGIAQLQRQSNPQTATRSGVAKLLELCKRSGDRATDIGFGLGPRINAVSRIHGDAHFCVELLTSRDPQRCAELAEATELANSRRRALQRDIAEQAQAQLAQLDLSTTAVIVLADEQWPVGILGLVASQIAQETGKPTILLSTEPVAGADPALARGSGRWFAGADGTDLYSLLQSQAHLLHRFGGHPLAAGLSLPVENLPLFTMAINQRLRQTSGDDLIPAPITADLQITVADLSADGGQALFQELKWIEPCGMGNPAPRLQLNGCEFRAVKNANIKDRRGKTVRYIKTDFELWDDTANVGFPGAWWGHYREELPPGRCDVIVELSLESYRKRYEVRLIAVRPSVSAALPQVAKPATVDWLLDWRGQPDGLQPTGGHRASAAPILQITDCPTDWADLQAWFRRARSANSPLALNYTAPAAPDPLLLWQRWIGLTKYLSRTGQTATRQQLNRQLGIVDRTLEVAIACLVPIGCEVKSQRSDGAAPGFAFHWPSLPVDESLVQLALAQFDRALREAQFRRQYFAQVPFATLQAAAQSWGDDRSADPRPA